MSSETLIRCQSALRVKKVAVVYHQFPHYRAPVLRALARGGRHHYSFWASLNEFSGIKSFPGDEIAHVHPLRVSPTKRGFRVRGYLPLLMDRSIDAFVILGNPNIFATWVLAAVARLQGRKVLFWAHGWLRREPPLKRLLRDTYFRLANMILVYGERAKTIGEQSGYPGSRIRVIYNSLDFDRASALFQKFGFSAEQEMPQTLFPDPSRPLFICTARLTPQCRFDLLISAASLLQQRGRPTNVLLVGNGQERASLERQAAELGVNVIFYGACYDEEAIGRMIYHADATVSPGKIGLTAIHSLSYGTPAITHGDRDYQMPEIEAITPGETGDFFHRGEASDLADTLERWLDRNLDRATVRLACHAAIAARWNPAHQRRLIDDAIDTCFGTTN